MKKIVVGIVWGGTVLAGGIGWGQTHKVAKPESVVRAIGVYEWTGDMAKPTASRLIPVSLYIDGKIEDAGIYIARPVPFALLSGNVYELEDAGIAKGTLELSYARHLQTADAAYDDGWFGYGVFHGLAPARKTTALRASKTLPVIKGSSDKGSDDSSKPHFSDKSGAPVTPAGSDSDKTKTDNTASSTTGSSTASADPDRPTMKRRGDSDTTTASTTTTAQGSGSTPADDPDRPTMKRRSSDSSTTSQDSASTKSAGDVPADDPDRPTMKRRTSDSSGTDSSGTDSTTTASTDSTKTGSDSPNDPDRPTLKRHSVEDAKRAQKVKDDVANVTPVGSLNDDPNRPNLHRGKPAAAMTEADLPKLSGLPTDLRQMVAVSDATYRSPHEFVRPWSDPEEKTAILSKMQTMARAQLASYGKPTPAAAAAPVAKKAATPASRTRRAAAPSAPPQVALLDEELKGYTLSYGGAATYVYTAHTVGTGADLRYVTVVVQDDGLGNLKPAMQNVTDAAHLDRTPRMRFVDVVDVEASNRASLLFEMRSQNSRQFALYRVIASHPDQIFLTGSTQ